MARRSRKAAWYTQVRGGTEAREALERRWADRTAPSRQQPADVFLAKAVTAGGSQSEPYHRWMRFAQGFSPELARAFLKETTAEDNRTDALPVLDPFSGSGTCVIECARRNIHAVGVEASPALAFLTDARRATECPPLPDCGHDESSSAIADRLSLPIHRAALMLAVASRHRADGRALKNAVPLAEVLRQIVSMIQTDFAVPLPRGNVVHATDARRLKPIATDSVGRILTSPPYLSRHDYARITRPYEQVYEHWYAPEDAPPKTGITESPNATQSHVPDKRIRAHPRATVTVSETKSDDLPGTVAEVRQSLDAIGEYRLAKIAVAYFADMVQVLRECHRVLHPGGTMWFVVGGARVKNVYVPCDLILAELAASIGLQIEHVRVARHLTDAGRKLGQLRNVKPRETLLVMKAG